MPAPAAEPINWQGIQANSVTLGIRGAARAAGANLPPDEQERFVKRVLKRAEREGWEDQRKAAMSSAGQIVVSRTAAPLAMSSRVVSAPDALAIALAEMGTDTKLAGMEYAKLVTEHARDRARTEPETALEAASNVKSALQSAAIAGSWQQQGVQVGVQVNVGGLSVD